MCDVSPTDGGRNTKQIRKRRRAPASERENEAALEALRRKITDPLDPDVNEFPEGWPNRFKGLHRLWLRKVLPYFCNDKDALKHAIIQYNKHESVDGSASLFGGILFDTPVEEFRQLAHNIAAHEIWAENAEAGLRALLSDREAALQLRRGAKNIDAQKKARRRGADKERQRILATLRADFLECRAKHAKGNRVFNLILEDLSEKHKPHDVKYIRKLLKSIDITRRNYWLIGT
jgi:hypothetical protein